MSDSARQRMSATHISFFICVAFCLAELDHIVLGSRIDFGGNIRLTRKLDG
jgi:hypothetical protein